MVAEKSNRLSMGVNLQPTSGNLKSGIKSEQALWSGIVGFELKVMTAKVLLSNQKVIWKDFVTLSQIRNNINVNVEWR